MTARTSVKKPDPRSAPEHISTHLPDGLSLEDEVFFLNELIHCIGDELLLLDHTGRIIFANDAALAGMGYSRKAVMGRRITEFFHHRMSLSAWRKEYFDYLRTHQHPVSYRIERKSGKASVPGVVDITAVLVYFKGREYILSVGRDVTRQSRLQKDLKSAKELYRMVSETAGDGILTLNKNGHVIYANRALQELLGLSFQQKNVHYTNFIAKKSRPEARKMFRGVMSGEHINRQRVDVVNLAGEVVPVEVTGSPIMDGERPSGIHAVVRDLRPRQDEELAARQEEKMEALQFFVAGTAQELKNPLLGLYRQADTMLDRYADRAFEYIGHREFKDIMANLNRMRDQLQYCYKTTERLITLNERRAGMKKKSSVADEVVRKTLKVKEEFLRLHDVDCRLNLRSARTAVRIGEVDLAQVLSNVVDNAVQAMPSGGTITIKSRLDRNADELILEVRDQGVGIPRDHLEHVFEPFFTTKSRGLKKNSGLGLPIAYALVKNVHGQMVIHSSRARGTVIQIHLPVYHPRRRKSKKTA
ncbi:MAG: PAS domain S-box protein [Candidatus Omnitrophota bacterium]